jgi:hypothetical protein
MTYLYSVENASSVFELAKNIGRADQLGGYDGVRALVEYYEDLAEAIGEPIEVDVIAWCCDWSYYGSATEAAEELSGWEPDEDSNDDDNEEAALEYLRDNTTVLDAGSGYLVLSF